MKMGGLLTQFVVSVRTMCLLTAQVHSLYGNLFLLLQLEHFCLYNLALSTPYLYCSTPYLQLPENCLYCPMRRDLRTWYHRPIYLFSANLIFSNTQAIPLVLHHCSVG